MKLVTGFPNPHNLARPAVIHIKPVGAECTPLPRLWRIWEYDPCRYRADLDESRRASRAPHAPQALGAQPAAGNDIEL